jgi:hypothetical protein
MNYTPPFIKRLSRYASRYSISAQDYACSDLVSGKTTAQNSLCDYCWCVEEMREGILRSLHISSQQQKAVIGNAVHIYMHNPVCKLSDNRLAPGVRTKGIVILSVSIKGRDNRAGIVRGLAQLGLSEIVDTVDQRSVGKGCG